MQRPSDSPGVLIKNVIDVITEASTFKRPNLVISALFSTLENQVDFSRPHIRL